MFPGYNPEFKAAYPKPYRIIHTGFLSFRKCRGKALLVLYRGIWRMLTCNSAHVPAALHRLLFHVAMEPANQTGHSQKGSGCYFTTSKSLIFEGSGPLLFHQTMQIIRCLSKACCWNSVLLPALGDKLYLLPSNVRRGMQEKKNQIFFFLIGSTYLRAYPKQLLRQKKYKLIWGCDHRTSYPRGHNNAKKNIYFCLRDSSKLMVCTVCEMWLLCLQRII